MACCKEDVAITCPACGHKGSYGAITVIDVVEDSTLKQMLFDGELNVFSCVKCMARLHYDGYALYTDRSKGLIVSIFSEDYAKERYVIALKMVHDVSKLSIDETKPNYIVFGYAKLAKIIALMDRELQLRAKESVLLDISHDEYRKLFIFGEEWIATRKDPNHESRLLESAGKLKEAQAAYKSGDIDKGISLYRDLVEFSPHYYSAHFNLALIMFNDRGDNDTALIHFNECVSLRPNDPECTFGIGQILVKKGAVDDALGYFAHSIINEPLNSVSWFNLGLGLAMLGKKEEGVEAMERSLDLSVNQEDKTIILKTIASVERKM